MTQSETQNALLAPAESIRAWARAWGTPLYLVDLSRITAAMDALRAGFAAHYPNVEITYSVKSNYLSGILRHVAAAGYRLEVVSRREIALAQAAGVAPAQLLLNGPVKSASDLAYCYQHSVDCNADSFEELEAAARLATPDRPFRLGLRIAARMHDGATSRFGLDLDDADTLARLRRLLASAPLRIAGLHLHHSSRRDAASFCQRLDQLRDAAARLAIVPEYLDIGGGVGSPPPPELAARLPYRVDPPSCFAATVGRHARATLGETGPRVILEPGLGVLAPAMNYVTSIVSVKPRAASDPILVCDGSLFDVNPLRSSLGPPCHLLDTPPSTAPRARQDLKLYGGTCMEIDQLGVLENSAGRPLPRPGSLIAVTNVGAYSASLAPEFIGPRPAVFAVDQRRLLRPACWDPFPGAGQ